MTSDAPVSLGIAGLGGYARTIIDLVLAQGRTTDPPVRLVAVCDPQPQSHGDLIDRLEAEGVAISDRYEAMLETPGLEAVWLPVPIDLHMPFAQAALTRGMGVMVEKPVAGTIDEVDQLIAARDAAGRPVLVGFQDVYDAAMYQLKQRVLAGALGPLERVSVRACWPRNEAYFTRSSWAGRLRHRGAWVLDSPVNNALAHFLNVPLFLAGPTLERSAKPTAIEAELYRAAAIENYDTASLRITLAQGTEVLVLFTHAAERTQHPVVELVGRRGRARWMVNDAELEVDGESIDLGRNNQMRRDMLESFARMLRGLPLHERCVATLEVARQHTLVVNGASQASPVVPVPVASQVRVDHQGSAVQAIPQIEDIFDACVAGDQMLHDSGRLTFTQPARRLDLKGYTHFAGPATA